MKTTIFKQLILNVITPVVIALLILGGLNYFNTKGLLEKFNENENYIISKEIYHYLSLQDLALEVLESGIDIQMKRHSNKLVNNYLKNTDNIESVDLSEIGNKLGLDPETEDIYIINRKGIVVNTTFKKDLHLNFFEFGEEHKNLLLSVLKEGVFVSERFAIEKTTQRVKKYTYQPTLNGEYIIELGVYSKKADEINERVRDIVEKISKIHESIVSVDLFMGEDNPFSLNKEAHLDDEQKNLITRLLKSQSDTSIHKTENERRYNYDYMFMYRENTNLYKSAVIRIISDRGDQMNYLWKELIKVLLIFILTLCAVIFLIYKKTKVITGPIKRLVENVTRISKGNFNERALVEGNNEVTKLSEHFNFMLEKIEEYYNDLEIKVVERTHEVVQQKEEIETQRDDLAEKNEHLEVAYTRIEKQNKHITDSIHYAQRIQAAILPPDRFVENVIPNSFILFKPKDIVSGDFYWIAKPDGVALIAAVDCTGHGVPGAFMSIIGNEHLNHVVNVIGGRRPNFILNVLNERITNALNQHHSSNKVKDGMDMTLCAIDFENKKISFAGANNPMYFVHNNKIQVIKGNKYPIGAYVGEELQHFSTHDIDYQAGDTLYMFSDGYADQFGGPDNRKFMYKKFRELLLSIQDKTMDEQKIILEERFANWKGDEEQIDDVLVIGIRLE